MSLSAMGWIQSSLGIDITGEWDSLVNINVGGCTFSCQRKTFKKCADTSVLCRMALSTDRGVSRAEDGSIMIDRDPETFRHVLNFLRSGCQRLILPDDFAEWDLLVDDARVYELPALAEAIRVYPLYQQRCFQRTLPGGVMLRWIEGSSSSVSSSSPSASSSSSTTTTTDSVANNSKPAEATDAKNSAVTANDTDKKSSENNDEKTSIHNNKNNNNNRPQIEVFPPLQHLTVDAASGQLMFQGRAVSSVDEAVSVLLFTFQMHVETWHRDVINGNDKKIAHTIFFTRRSKP